MEKIIFGQKTFLFAKQINTFRNCFSSVVFAFAMKADAPQTTSLQTYFVLSPRTKVLVICRANVIGNTRSCLLRKQTENILFIFASLWKCFRNAAASHTRTPSNWTAAAAAKGQIVVFSKYELNFAYNLYYILWCGKCGLRHQFNSIPLKWNILSWMLFRT